MKNLYESILSSVGAGKNHYLNDPDAFAQEYLHLTDKHYFVSNGYLFITSFQTNTFVIDKDFPDIKFKIALLGCVGNKKIITKDFSAFRRYFATRYDDPVKVGFHILKTAATTYIQDPDFVSEDPEDFENIIAIEGNLVIDKAKKISWSSFPKIDGNITLNAENISILQIPVGSKTSIIKINGRK